MTMAPKNNALVTIIAAANTVINTGSIAYLLLLMIKVTRNNNNEDISLTLPEAYNFPGKIKNNSTDPCYHLTMDSCSLPVQEFPGESLWSWCSLSLLTLWVIVVCAAGVPLNWEVKRVGGYMKINRLVREAISNYKHVISPVIKLWPWSCSHGCAIYLWSSFTIFRARMMPI